jgi:hypothetical protein
MKPDLGSHVSHVPEGQFPEEFSDSPLHDCWKKLAGPDNALFQVDGGVRPNAKNLHEGALQQNLAVRPIWKM